MSHGAQGEILDPNQEPGHLCLTLGLILTLAVGPVAHEGSGGLGQALDQEHLRDHSVVTPIIPFSKHTRGSCLVFAAGAELVHEQERRAVWNKPAYILEHGISTFFVASTFFIASTFFVASTFFITDSSRRGSAEWIDQEIPQGARGAHATQLRHTLLECGVVPREDPVARRSRESGDLTHD